MAYYYQEPSHTFSEYLLIPGYTSEECIPDNVSLRTPLVKYRKGQEEPAIALNVPLTSAVASAAGKIRLPGSGEAGGGYRLRKCGAQPLYPGERPRYLPLLPLRRRVPQRQRHRTAELQENRSPGILGADRKGVEATWLSS